MVAKNKGGRPKKPFNKELFEELCEIQCTREEIASVLKMGETTLTEKVLETYGMTYARVFKIYSAGGKSSLRRAMYKKAMQGDPAMLKWLSANQLGMSDKKEHKVEDRKVVKIRLDGSKPSDEPQVNNLIDSESWEVLEDESADE